VKPVKTPTSVLGWVLVALGFAVIGAGWAGVQSTPVVAVQLAYLTSGGFVGLALVMVGVGISDREDVRAIRSTLEELRDRFDDLEHDVRDLAEERDGTRPRRRSQIRAS